MPMTNYGARGFLAGVSVRGMPIAQTNPGTVYWLDNSNPSKGGTGSGPNVTRCTAGADGNPGTFDRPMATLAGALLRCQQGVGDVIMIKPGHAERISSATALALNVAAVAIVGLGVGSSRPTFTLDTATTATIAVQASNISIQNCIFQANFANIASIFTASAASVTASIAANVMTVTAVGSGTIIPGANLASAAAPGTVVLQQLTGTLGGIGTYLVSLSQTLASTTVTTGTTDFTIERCEFRDLTSVLNALSVFTAGAIANACDGFRFAFNRVSSLGTTAATTALVFGAGADRVQIEDNFGSSAVLNDTAAVFAGSTFQFTNLSIGRNVWQRPNTSSTGGSFISGSGNAWTGMAYDNYFYQVDATAGIWIATGHGSAFGYQNNFSPITGAVDKSGLINPAAV